MMAAVAPDYGDRIRLRRQALDLTQEELARRVGVDPSSVISWEKYRHAPKRWQGKIEAVLGISLSGEREQPDPNEAVLQNSIDGLDRDQQQQLIEAYRAIRNGSSTSPGRKRAG